MLFREMSKDMTNEEIELILSMVYPYAHMVKFTRIIPQNFIEVFFTVSSEAILYRVDFLPDDIYVYDSKGNITKDGELIEDKNILYSYQQFMIANGYSEIWLNNPYNIKTETV